MRTYDYTLDADSLSYDFDDGNNDNVVFTVTEDFIEAELSITIDGDGNGGLSSIDFFVFGYGNNIEFQQTLYASDLFAQLEFSYNGYTSTIVITGDPELPVYIPCFTRGAKVATPDCERPIEDLCAGDLVLTRDNGAQPIRWVGSSTLTAETLAQFPDRRPVKIAAGALGDHAETLVSPHHRMLITGWQAQALFGEAEVLASAKSLVNDATIRQVDVDEVEYFHMLFDAHEIVQVDGAWSESFHPAALATSMEAATRDEVLTLFPELEAGAMPDPAHRTLRPEDVQVLQG